VELDQERKFLPAQRRPVTLTRGHCKIKKSIRVTAGVAVKTAFSIGLSAQSALTLASTGGHLAFQSRGLSWYGFTIVG
jgi:hypothetical protein